MSEVKVNKISPRTACGTVTLGDSGDTFTIPSGATITNNGTQTGFGRTGTVDWDTSIKTGTVTAVSGSGYFVNTTSGGITVNLPAAAVGSIVAVSDYASTADSNNITVSPNGSDKINGANEDYTMDTKGLAVTLVYADATRGWKSVTGSDADATGVGALFVTATGGTPCSGAIVCTNYKVHTFTGPGTFCVSAAGNACGSNTVDYMVVAGGGGGTYDRGGGGGAGGYRESPGTASGCYAVSPLGAAPAVALPVPATGYPIVVGGGGAGGTPPADDDGCKGSDSSFSTITSTGGGAGLYTKAATPTSGPGGSGGGAGYGACFAGGAGNTPPFNPAQGMPGGTGSGGAGGAGGGGATVVGGNPPPSEGGIGGTGATTSIDATPTARAGGAGGSSTGSPAAGGAGGGGTGGAPPGDQGTDGTVNTGGGGGGSRCNTGGAGGSGVVIIRYKFQ